MFARSCKRGIERGGFLPTQRKATYAEQYARKKKQMAQERQTSKQVQKERDKRKKNVRSMQLTQRPKRKYRRAVVKSRSADLRMLGLCQNKTRL